MTIDYFLSESVFTFSGVVKYTRDQFGSGGEVRQIGTDVTVTMGVRGDDGAGLQTLAFGRGGVDEDFTVALSPDGRLVSISYKATGVGGRVLGAAAKVVAFVGGLAVSAALRSPSDAISKSTGPKSAVPMPTPEELATLTWAANNEALAAQRDDYATLITKLAADVLASRKDAASATTASMQLDAIAKARRCQQLLEDARREVDRIDTLYHAWRASTIKTREEARVHDVSIASLPKGEAGAVPDPSLLGLVAAKVWKELGVIAQVEPATGRRLVPRRDSPERDDEEESRVRWRIPRPVRITVWRANSGGKPTLERSFPTLIVDEHCDTSAFSLRASLFGEETAEMIFDGLGTPTKISSTTKNAAGQIADALSGVPEAVSGGLDSASKIQTLFTGLVDAGEVRLLAGLKRRLESAQADLDLKGLAATEQDFAELKRLQQEVLIAEAHGKLAPASQTSQIEDELRLVKARTDLHAARRSEAIEMELDGVRAEVARLHERLNG